MKKLYFMIISCIVLGFVPLHTGSHEYIDEEQEFVFDPMTEYKKHSIMLWRRDYTYKNFDIMQDFKLYHHKLRTLYPHHAATQKKYAMADLTFELMALQKAEEHLAEFSSAYLAFHTGVKYIPNKLDEYFGAPSVEKYKIFSAWSAANKEFVLTGSFEDEFKAIEKQYAHLSLKELEETVVDTHKKLRAVLEKTPSIGFMNLSVAVPLVLAGTLLAATSGRNYLDENGLAANVDRTMLPSYLRNNK